MSLNWPRFESVTMNPVITAVKDFVKAGNELAVAAMAVSLFISCLVIYRLFLHPLAGIPGPKLAAATGLYEAYYDCIRSGKFTFKIEELHRRYGPIVRINPREVHIDDSSFYNQFYNMQNRLNKDVPYYRFNGDYTSTFATADAEEHRLRKKAIAKYFSPRALTGIEEIARRNVSILCRRVAEAHSAGDSTINLSDAFRSFTTDTVTRFCLPIGSAFLESENLGHDYNKWVRTFSYMTTLNRHLVFLMPLFTKIPPGLVQLFASQGSIEAYKFQMSIVKQVSDAMALNNKSPDTLLDGLINADLPEADKRMHRIIHETHTIVGAGSETTASTLEKIFFHVLSRPELHQKLRDELTGLDSESRTSYEVLRRLPYLQAVVNEGLRVTSGVCARLPRVNPKADTSYKSYRLPAGTVISMGVRGVHHDPEIFPDPFRFEPARWLEEDGFRRLAPFLVPFGKGARSCIGQDVALMEISILTACLFARFGMELHETNAKDIRVEHEFFSPFPSKGFKGVMVRITDDRIANQV